MADNTGIEWADSTFNPWMGCTKVSPACDHCYAERDTKRFGRVEWGQGKPRVRTSAGNWKKPLQWNTQAFVECPECQWRGEWREADVRNGCCPSCNHLPRLFKPARRRVFCASLADVFDNEVDPAWRYDLFNLILSTPNLDWMLLTKRIGNAAKMIAETLPENMKALPQDHPLAWPWPNVWIGATICNQEEADRDIPKLLAVPAAVRFLSMEPLLGVVDIESACDIAEAVHCAGTWDQMDDPQKCALALRHGSVRLLDWVIVGGESGPNARPMHPDWVRSLRDQCAASSVPFIFKQWGEWAPGHLEYGNILDFDLRVSSIGFEWYTGDVMTCKVLRVGKKAAGRLLDGAQHDGYPGGVA